MNSRSSDGCVDFSTRLVTNDGSLTCDITGQSIFLLNGGSDMIEQTRLLYVTDVVATLLTNTNENTTLVFTGSSDIYTAVNLQ